MVTKVYFPRLVLPLSACLRPLLDFGIGLVVLVILMLCPCPSGCRNHPVTSRDLADRDLWIVDRAVAMCVECTLQGFWVRRPVHVAAGDGRQSGAV